MECLTGKWRYKEEYDYGETVGELSLQQEGNRLSGKIIFTDRTIDGDSYMIREILSGTLDGRKIKLEARELDVIHSEYPLQYELDKWFGIWVDERTIIGLSMDAQGVEGFFTFEKE
ncbi:MAG: hypothetical protein LBP56_06500 [Odoribacteraceae bacterium]|jgi:hypothetical protein|nr:hypothetical protein [Odoribacteraceae bacterium]